MKKLFTVFLIACCGASAFAQTSDSKLDSLLSGKRKFYDIKETVVNYFQSQIKKLAVTETKKRKAIERNEKFWNRWLFENESRLDENGEMVNIGARSWEAVQQRNTSNQIAPHTAFGNWSEMGPTLNSSGIGRVNRLAFDPVSANVVYAGTAAGGLWKTTNGGISWTALRAFLPSLGVSGIVVSHNNPNEIYVLTGDGDANSSGGFSAQWGYAKYSMGVLKSTDGGNTWFRTGRFKTNALDFGLTDADRYWGLNLVQDPLSANVLMVVTNKGIFKTIDGGISWLRINITTSMGQNGSGSSCYDIAYKPGSSSIVYAATADGFYRSTDGGNNFSQVVIPNLIPPPSQPPSAPNTTFTRMNIETSPHNPNVVYILAGPGFVLRDDNSDDRYMGFFRSTNSGASFSRVHNEPDLLAYDDVINTFKHQSWYDLALAVSPTNSSMAITGGLVAWRTDDAGIDFSEITDYFEDADNSNYIHPDIHDLKYNPLNGMLWAATDGGVAFSTDDGISWVQRFNLPITQFYHFEPANDDDYIWGGSQDNGIMEQDAAGSPIFNEYSGGDGYDVLTDVENRDDIFYVTNKDIYTDGSISSITPNGIDEYFPLLAMHPTNENILYAGYSRLFISQANIVRIWKPFMFDRDTIQGQWALTTCPSNGNRVYAAGIKDDKSNPNLWRIDDATTDLPQVTRLSNNIPYPLLWNYSDKITDIAVSPINSNFVTITLGGYSEGRKVLHSNDAGVTWQNWSYNLPNVPVNTVITDGDGNMYIGTDIGVYYSNNSLAGWQPFYNNLPPVPVSELAFHNVGNTQYIYAATYGRGIWRSKIFQNCSDNITVAEPLVGPKFFQSANQLQSSSSIHGGAGTVINFQSGNEIVLTPEFSAQYGSYLNAVIAPCNSGLPAGFASRMEVDSSNGKPRLLPTHYIYGKIASIVHTNGNLQVDLVINKPGLYELKIADSSNNIIQSVQKTTLTQIGKHSFSLDKNKLPQSAFMLQLYYQDKLVNGHEIN